MTNSSSSRINFSLSKLGLIFTFIYITTVLTFSCVLVYINLKIDSIVKTSVFLSDENAGLKEQIVLLNQKLMLQNAYTPIITPSSMSDEYKMFIIKVGLIILGLTLCGCFISYSFFYMKSFLINHWLIKFIAGFNGFSSSFFYKYFGIGTNTEYTYIDKFENIVKILVSEDQKNIDVLIKTVRSTDFVSLSDFFGSHPELFDRYTEASSGIISGAAVNLVNHSNALEALNLFNSINSGS